LKTEERKLFIRSWGDFQRKGRYLQTEIKILEEKNAVLRGASVGREKSGRESHLKMGKPWREDSWNSPYARRPKERRRD